tara:strand:+ start:66 stop:404 length:339 start_codon:yes stop_codon:yes gene_type:complete
MPKNKRDKQNLDFIKDGMTTQEIIDTIDNIRKEYNFDIITDNEKTILKKKYELFSKRYPMLFDTIIEPIYDQNRLLMFLNMRDKIVNNEKTFEDASKDIGNVMFKEYVKDKY